jgi:hypothetical protein
LDTPVQVATLGLEEIFERDAVVLIEWGERLPHLMPQDAWPGAFRHRRLSGVPDLRGRLSPHFQKCLDFARMTFLAPRQCEMSLRE